MIHFVTETLMLEIVPINNNVDAKNLTVWIKPVSETVVRPMVGREAYASLLLKYNNQTLNSDEAILVEQMQQVIAWYSASRAIVSLTVPLKNIGAQRMYSENSSSANDSDQNTLTKTYEEVANQYQRDLAKFIKDNREKYPLITLGEDGSTVLNGTEDETGGFANLFGHT